MKPRRNGRLLHYDVQEVSWNFFRYSNIRSLLRTSTFHKLIPTRLPNCWKFTQQYLKLYTWAERISSWKKKRTFFFPQKGSQTGGCARCWSQGNMGILVDASSSSRLMKQKSNRWSCTRLPREIITLPFTCCKGIYLNHNLNLYL